MSRQRCMGTTPRRRLTRADWLEVALKAIDKGGLEAVRVLPLASVLKASRGSFYWHFRDRAELLDAVLEHWDTEWTDAVIERSLSGSVDAAERLSRLADEVIGQRRGRYDAAIRAWAQHDKRAAAVVRRVDRKRTAYLRSLFRGIGFADEDAEVRSRLLLGYFVGDHSILVNEPPAKRSRLVRLRLELLTRPTPD